jgi:hypothetical protein
MGSPFGNIEVRGERENNLMSYTRAAYSLESVVTWTLTPLSTGTHPRMEQSGFRPDQQQAYQGANYGSPFEEIPKYAARVRFVVVPVMSFRDFGCGKAMSFDDLFRRDRPNKTLQRTAAGMAVPCQSQHTGLASVPFSLASA